MKTIQIKSEIELKKYINLVYTLTYKKPYILLITLIGIVLLILSILYFTGLYEASSPPYFHLIFGLFMTVVLPYSIYRSATKNFDSNQRLSEEITYEFDHELIHIKGESFQAELTWPKSYKVLELNSWILIYQNKLVANIIPKDSFSTEQLIEFRELVQGLPDVKSKFKK